MAQTWRERFERLEKTRLGVIKAPTPFDCEHPRTSKVACFLAGEAACAYQCLTCGVIRSVAIGDNQGLPPMHAHAFTGGPHASIDCYLAHKRKTLEWFKEEWWRLYKSYLDSPEWAAKREARFVLDSRQCMGGMAGCSGAAEHCHHLGKAQDCGGTGAYEFVGDEPIFLLVSLCFSCHNKIHGGKLA